MNLMPLEVRINIGLVSRQNSFTRDRGERTMNDIMVIKIVFGILLAIGGTVLLFIAFKVYYKYLVLQKKCTERTEGIVKKYTMVSYGGENSNIHLPIVQYMVDGKKYKVVGPEYKVYITLTKESLNEKNEMEHTEKDNQIMMVNRKENAFISIKENPIKKMYPIDSTVDVYYDPQNPKLSYVLRYCNKKWAFYLTFISGICVWVLDVLIQVLL